MFKTTKFRIVSVTSALLITVALVTAFLFPFNGHQPLHSHAISQEDAYDLSIGWKDANGNVAHCDSARNSNHPAPVFVWNGIAHGMRNEIEASKQKDERVHPVVLTISQKEERRKRGNVRRTIDLVGQKA